MFTCEVCKLVSKPKEPKTMITTQTRVKEYRDYSDQVISRGTEIVKEIALCPSCVAYENRGLDVSF